VNASVKSSFEVNDSVKV